MVFKVTDKLILTRFMWIWCEQSERVLDVMEPLPNIALGSNKQKSCFVYDYCNI